MEEVSGGLKVTEPGYKRRTVMYKRAVIPGSLEKMQALGGGDGDGEESDRLPHKQRRLLDVIVKGEVSSCHFVSFQITYEGLIGTSTLG